MSNLKQDSPALLLMANPIALGVAAATAAGGVILWSMSGSSKKKDGDETNEIIERDNYFKITDNELRYWAAYMSHLDDPNRVLVDALGDVYGKNAGNYTDLRVISLFPDSSTTYLQAVCSNQNNIQFQHFNSENLQWQHFRFLERVMRACYVADQKNFLIGDTFAKAVDLKENEKKPYPATKYFKWNDAAIITIETDGVLYCSSINHLIGPFQITIKTKENNTLYLIVNMDLDYTAKFSALPENGTFFFCDHSGRLIFQKTRRFWRCENKNAYSSVGPTTTSVRLCNCITREHGKQTVLSFMDKSIYVLSTVNASLTDVLGAWNAGFMSIPVGTYFIQTPKDTEKVTRMWPLYDGTSSSFKLNTLPIESTNDTFVPGSVVTFCTDNSTYPIMKAFDSLLLNRNANVCALFSTQSLTQSVNKSDDMTAFNNKYFEPNYLVRGHQLYLCKDWCFGFPKAVKEKDAMVNMIEMQDSKIVGFSPTVNMSIVVAWDVISSDIGNLVNIILARKQKIVLCFIYGNTSSMTPIALATKCGLNNLSENFSLNEKTDTVQLESQTKGMVTLFRVFRSTSNINSKYKYLQLYPKTNENFFQKHQWKYYWTDLEISNPVFAQTWSNLMGDQGDIFNVLC